MCASSEKLSLGTGIASTTGRRIGDRWSSRADRLGEGLCSRLRRFLDLQYASIYRDIAFLARRMRGDVLDVGCGAQPFRHLLAGKCIYRGIDSAQAQVDFGPRFPDTTYFDGNQWPVGHESVDYVLTTETMEHVLDSEVFLQEAHRCLRPGGQIIVTVPFSARWHFIPYDYWRFTPSVHLSGC